MYKRQDGIDSLIQIGEGLFRIIRPEQVAAHPVAMGAINHLFCTGCFEKLELPAAVPDRPIHDLQGIPSSCGTAAGDIRRDFQGGAQHTRPADDIGVIPAVVSVQQPDDRTEGLNVIVQILAFIFRRPIRLDMDIKNGAAGKLPEYLFKPCLLYTSPSPRD